MLAAIGQMDPEDQARAVEILKELERTEWQRLIHHAWDSLQEQMAHPGWPESVRLQDLMQRAPITRILFGGIPRHLIEDPLGKESGQHWNKLEWGYFLLSPDEQERAVWILHELQLTDWQRWFNGFKAANAGGEISAEGLSYHDALVEAKERTRIRKKLLSEGPKTWTELREAVPDPVSPTWADFAGGLLIDAELAKRPDEQARRKRVQDEMDERHAAMLRESQAHTSAVKAQKPINMEPMRDECPTVNLYELAADLVGAERPASERPRMRKQIKVELF